ncbi:hypothetical protein Ndes2526B_g09133 [Nannochloris sp. 'desiccata']
MSSARRERFTKAFTESLKACSKEVHLYGNCIKNALPEVDKGVCEREFGVLKACWRVALRASLAKSR